MLGLLIFFIRLPNRIHDDIHTTYPVCRLLERKRTMVYGTRDLDVTERDVYLKSVSFTYLDAAGNSIQLLENLDLFIPARRATAVVGPSGVGKTTILGPKYSLPSRLWYLLSIDGTTLT